MKIGELAAAAGTPVETIRYYEREGLLPATPRSEGNYRIYEASHVERLAFVRHCRSLDMTLEEIRVLLGLRDAPEAECGGVNALLDEHIGHVATRIRELRKLEKQLKALRDQCDEVRDAAQCGILGGLAREAQRAVLRRAPIGGSHGRPEGQRPAARRRGAAR
ncbi:MAG TPA: Cd(II)/Pb(II)-responsive transcriptional regulator [Methylibium sp.]|uniref:Cd(II)/Pb(II)-responsive transcriptional regulator n=1 Tax=Methylibium sp. TaxID=2067992 RepID=UPI002DB8A48E|nr:Cd(II)/Pb(II)-responsive transcriptional regulator [Methylibium sp.]HEU4459948.1 Cd(II)/Pb(II)-responsive transcriptional regulator [Methylibium sp.]